MPCIHIIRYFEGNGKGAQEWLGTCLVIRLK